MSVEAQLEAFEKVANQRRESLAKKEGELDRIKKDLRIQIETIKEQKEDYKIIQQAVEALRVLAEAKREELKSRIEALVTRALQAVFERDDYGFEFQMDMKRGNMVAKPVLHKQFQGKDIIVGLDDGSGGGVRDICAFVLQVVVLALYRPKQGKVLIGDECFKHVSRNYLPKVAQLLSYLNNLAKMQFILVTHKEEFIDVADKVYEVSINSKGESKVKPIE